MGDTAATCRFTGPDRQYGFRFKCTCVVANRYQPTGPLPPWNSNPSGVAANIALNLRQAAAPVRDLVRPVVSRSGHCHLAATIHSYVAYRRSDDRPPQVRQSSGFWAVSQTRGRVFNMPRPRRSTCASYRRGSALSIMDSSLVNYAVALISGAASGRHFWEQVPPAAQLVTDWGNLPECMVHVNPTLQGPIGESCSVRTFKRRPSKSGLRTRAW